MQGIHNIYMRHSIFDASTQFVLLRAIYFYCLIYGFAKFCRSAETFEAKALQLFHISLPQFSRHIIELSP